MTPTKTCTRCGTAKPADNRHYHAHAGTRDGLHTQCRECRKTKARDDSRAYYERNRDRCRAYSRHYYRTVAKLRNAGVSA